MKTLAFVIFFIAISVIFGWITGNVGLLTWTKEGVTTTPTSALNLSFISLSYLFLLWDIEKKCNTKEILTTLFGTWTAGLTTLVIYSKLLGNYSILERLLVVQVQQLRSEGVEVALTPALGTIICFYILSTVPWIYLYNTKNASRRIRAISVLIMIISSFALCGHLFNSPNLYYSSEGISSGISLIMSASFMMCGIILYYIANQLKYKSYLNGH